jgi:hypothetical protein
MCVVSAGWSYGRLAKLGAGKERIPGIILETIWTTGQVQVTKKLSFTIFDIISNFWTV